MSRDDNRPLGCTGATVPITIQRKRHRAHPLVTNGWVVLSDHLHCVLELPLGDANFAVRLHLSVFFTLGSNDVILL